MHIDSIIHSKASPLFRDEDQRPVRRTPSPALSRNDYRRMVAEILG